VVKLGTEIESPQTGERLIFRSTEKSSGGELFQAELIVQPGDYVISPHVHQNQEEQFVVLEGRFAVYIGDTLVIADAGETVVCPKGVPHSQWNAGSGVLRILYEHRPGLEAAEIFFETFFGLSRDGKLTKTGDLTLLQGSVLVPEVGDFIKPTSPPLWLQPILFGVVRPFARLLGYRARYPEYALPTDDDA
jgi:mannose-6-phosphate isomerase-like protein (cupin superfamily)